MFIHCKVVARDCPCRRRRRLAFAKLNGNTFEHTFARARLQVFTSASSHEPKALLPSVVGRDHARPALKFDQIILFAPRLGATRFILSMVFFSFPKTTTATPPYVSTSARARINFQLIHCQSCCEATSSTWAGLGDPPANPPARTDLNAVAGNRIA